MEEPMKLLFLTPGIACLIIGVVFLLLYRYTHNENEDSQRRLTAPAWAKLVRTDNRMEYDYDNKRRTVYYGIYEYDSADGQHISSTSSCRYYVPQDIPGIQGNMVKIYYNPKNPAEYYITEEQAMANKTLPTFKNTGVFMTVLGIILTVAGIAVLLGAFDPILDKLMDL